MGIMFSAVLAFPGLPATKMAAFRRADWESTNAMLVLELIELSLLLSPLGASLTLGTFVRLGKELLDGDNRYRLGRGDEVVVLWGLSAATFALAAMLSW